MYIKKIGSKNVVILLHEIYGINQYMEDWAMKFNAFGYDVYCMDFVNQKDCFSYLQQQDAYDYFMSNVGFEVHKKVECLVEELYNEYEKVVVFGSSVGATIAWLVSSNKCCSAVIGYYGSRIRDYLDIDPECPCLLLFASEESFNVQEIISKLNDKQSVNAKVLDAKHGFADQYSKYYHKASATKAIKLVEAFLNLK